MRFIHEPLAQILRATSIPGYDLNNFILFEVLLDCPPMKSNIKCPLLFLLLGISCSVPIVQYLCNHGDVKDGREGENSQHVLVPSLLHRSEDTRRVSKQ